MCCIVGNLERKGLFISWFWEFGELKVWVQPLVRVIVILVLCTLAEATGKRDTFTQR